MPSVLENVAEDGTFELDGDNAKKVVKVLRMNPGDTFIAFDGRGGEWEGALTYVEGAGRARARATLLSERDVQQTRRVLVSIAQAIPKGDKMDLVLQKGTELGVAEFWPFEAERSVARLSLDEDAQRAGVRTERWRRIVAGAASQCGRADVPVVHAIGEFATAVDYGMGAGRCFMLDEGEDAEPLRVALTRDPVPWDDEFPPRIMLLIGPEGGWTERERDWAQRYGAEPVGLGKRILRTETAALVATTILSWEAGEF